MKIARVVPFLDFGGIEKVVEIAALEFSRHYGIEHVVIVLSHKGRVAKQLESSQVEVICLNQSPRIPNPFLIFKLYRLFRLGQFDVVHSSGAEANFHGIIAAFLAGVKTRVGEEIGFPNHHLVWRIIFRFVYSLASKVIVISEAVKNELISHRELTTKKAVLVYNPAQMPLTFPTEKKNAGYLTFVMVSRLTPIKNIPATLRAFSGLDSSYQNRYRLVIVGDGEQKEDLQAMIFELGLENTVTLTGYQANVSGFLYSADVFLIPSISEGSSVALAEAMLHGLPSIVTSVGGASEIVGTSKSAVFVNPESIDEIREATQYFLDLPPSELKMMGTRAKQHARVNYSPRQYSENLLSIYKTPV